MALALLSGRLIIALAGSVAARQSATAEIAPVAFARKYTLT